MNSTSQSSAWGSALLLVTAVGAGIIPIIVFAVSRGGGIVFDAYIWKVLQFTLLQATLSTVLSIVIALPAAVVLGRYHFFGKHFMLTLFAIPQIMPAIVVVMGLAGVFGNNGWFPQIFNLYGLTGILLAHVFFNAALCIRLFASVVQGASQESRNLAQQLGLNTMQEWLHVEWPLLRNLLPRAAALVFLYCAASFVVVLTFGGPAATTLEVAIFQSLRLDFDLSKAATLSSVQIILCLILVRLAGSLAGQQQKPTLAKSVAEQALRPVSVGVILAATILPVLLVALPLVNIAWNGFFAIRLRPELLQAALTSLVIAFVSAGLCVALAWPLSTAAARAKRGGQFFGVAAVLGLIVPPAVLATGWFLILQYVPTHIVLSLGLIALLGTLMALPLVFAILTSAKLNKLVAYDQLCDQLGLSGWDRFKHIDFPLLRGAIFQSFLLAGVLSLGDLTAVMMLGTNGIVTLPSLIASEMGNYRSSAAQGTAFLLAVMCIGATTLAQWMDRENQDVS